MNILAPKLFSKQNENKKYSIKFYETLQLSRSHSHPPQENGEKKKYKRAVYLFVNNKKSMCYCNFTTHRLLSLSYSLTSFSSPASRVHMLQHIQNVNKKTREKKMFMHAMQLRMESKMFLLLLLLSLRFALPATLYCCYPSEMSSKIVNKTDWEEQKKNVFFLVFFLHNFSK